MVRRDRLVYGLVRHPLSILLAYFGIFVAGFLLKPALDDAKRHRDCLPAIALHLMLLACLLYWNWVDALLLYWLPLMLAQAMGAYLFYAQHNFPGVKLRERREWSYEFAAVYSSSFLDIHPVLHWLTATSAITMCII